MLAALRRHKWTATGVWVAVTIAAAAWSSKLAGLYRAEALVLVESRRIPEWLIPAGADADLKKRLERARQNLLSSHELQTTIRRLDPYPDQRRSGATQDSLLAQFRASVSISPPGQGSSAVSGPVRISFEHPDAGTAARVANHLAGQFIAEITSARRTAYAATTRFLAAHVASARRELELRETALCEFRLRNADELPEQAEVLRAEARRLRAELAALRAEAQALERHQRALEQAARPQLPKLQSAASARPAVPESGAARRRSQADTLRTRLTALLALYQPSHPDVRRLRAELAEAERLESELAAHSQTEPLPNGVHPELPKPPPGNRPDAARLEQIQARLEALAARRIQAAAELGATEQRLQRLPLREQELAALRREQAFFAEQFRGLATRLQSAELAEALERSYPPERAVLLEEARPPGRPLGSIRWALLAVASLGGLLAGGLLAIARTLDAPAKRRPQPWVHKVPQRSSLAVPT